MVPGGGRARGRAPRTHRRHGATPRVHGWSPRARVRPAPCRQDAASDGPFNGPQRRRGRLGRGIARLAECTPAQAPVKSLKLISDLAARLSQPTEDVVQEGCEPSSTRPYMRMRRLCDFLDEVSMRMDRCARCICAPCVSGRWTGRRARAALPCMRRLAQRSAACERSAAQPAAWRSSRPCTWPGNGGAPTPAPRRACPPAAGLESRTTCAWPSAPVLLHSLTPCAKSQRQSVSIA